MDTCTLQQGTAPLLISVPHDGQHVPEAIAARLSDDARRVPDTDWHVARLYRGIAEALGASLLVPTHSRYVIDLNRAEDDVSLYPGQNTTGLCPLVMFSGDPVYRAGDEPDEAEIRARVETYWRPYHDALRNELDRLRIAHGRVLLWEAHSIRSVVPFLFEGTLPHLNLGTAGGNSCSPSLQVMLTEVLRAQDDYSTIVNGRFQGGYITRHYGDPAAGIEAVQLEISQRIYMDEETFAFDEGRAVAARRVIGALLEASFRVG